MTKFVKQHDERPADVPVAEARPNIGKLLAGTYLAAVQMLDQRLRESGYPDVRPSHGTVFQVIDAEGTRVTDLAARAGMTKQAMTELVAHLERGGYLERAADPADGRAKLVTLTRRGWECIGAARAIIDELEAEWTERLGTARMRELRRGLEALYEAVGAQPAWPRTTSA
jgi:DNA-binding MarR family transcriptional regulator